MRIEQERLGQKCLTPRNKKKFTKIAFQIFVNFGLFPKELLLLSPFIRESVANLIFRFVPHPLNLKKSTEANCQREKRNPQKCEKCFLNSCLFLKCITSIAIFFTYHYTNCLISAKLHFETGFKTVLINVSIFN